MLRTLLDCSSDQSLLKTALAPKPNTYGITVPQPNANTILLKSLSMEHQQANFGSDLVPYSRGQTRKPAKTRGINTAKNCENTSTECMYERDSAAGELVCATKPGGENTKTQPKL